jgi:hypothetical protein
MSWSPLLHQMNAVHAFQPYFPKIKLNPPFKVSLWNCGFDKLRKILNRGNFSDIIDLVSLKVNIKLGKTPN